MSLDEKPGIRARERLYPNKPTRPGWVKRIEFEYQRHGTLYLISTFHVSTGQLICPRIGPSRNEADFSAHVAATLGSVANASWMFVLDQLNTHYS
ncbi:MAG: transposase, partial [Gammaproteobacteria bacterium]|nr:transposase [Gammaproteobacteria bacterium]